MSSVSIHFGRLSAELMRWDLKLPISDYLPLLSLRNSVKAEPPRVRLDGVDQFGLFAGGNFQFVWFVDDCAMQILQDFVFDESCTANDSKPVLRSQMSHWFVSSQAES